MSISYLIVYKEPKYHFRRPYKESSSQDLDTKIGRRNG